MELRYNLRSGKLDINEESMLLKKYNCKEIKIELKQEPKSEEILYKTPTIKNSMATFCNVCSNYYYGSNYRRHKIMHKRTTRCDICSQRLTDDGLKRHSCLDDMHCIICNEKFPCRSKLDAHFTMHSNIENRKSLTLGNADCQSICSLCGLIIDSDKINEHNMIHNIYACEFCDKVSKGKSKYIMHRRMHLKKLNHPCKECDETFEHLVNLARHVSVVHRKHDPSKTECPICFKMVSGISPHLRTHQVSPTQCEICGATLKNVTALKSHVRFHNILSRRGHNRAIIPKDTNNKKCVNKCQICEKKFRQSVDLSSHLKSHIQVSLFTCPYCDDYTCCFQEDLISHVSSVHRQVPSGYSQCPHCADVVTDLQSHIVTHKIPLYDCEMCPNVAFMNQSAYRKHMTRKHQRKTGHRHYLEVYLAKCGPGRVPANRKRVPCLQCDQRVRVCHMRSHLRAVHRSYRCPDCGKRLATETHLRAHRAVHDSVLGRHGCTVCPYGAATHVRLLAHMKADHNLPFSTARACAICR